MTQPKNWGLGEEKRNSGGRGDRNREGKTDGRGTRDIGGKGKVGEPKIV